VEHAQPLDRPLPWRALALFASVVALAAGSWLLLAQHPARTRPVPRSGRVPKRQVVTPLRSRSRISVLVLNGNGISGAAGGVATGLLAHGYRHAIPSDAPSLAYARSLVLYRPGWRREAERLARDVRIPTVAPLDGRVAPAYASVPLVVILGAK
jgi:LytR cell envelope-related transcriptional attenuator